MIPSLTTTIIVLAVAATVAGIAVAFLWATAKDREERR